MRPSVHFTVTDRRKDKRHLKRALVVNVKGKKKARSMSHLRREIEAMVGARLRIARDGVHLIHTELREALGSQAYEVMDGFMNGDRKNKVDAFGRMLMVALIEDHDYEHAAAVRDILEEYKRRDKQK